MTFDPVYLNKNFMGKHASDAAALTFIQSREWDDAGDGTGDPRGGVFYYNTASGKLRYWDDIVTLGWLDLLTATGSMDNSIQDFRVSTSNTDPIGDLGSSATVYLTSYKGNRIALYYTGSWGLYSAASGTPSVGTFGNNTNYDIFAYYDGAAVQLEKVAWTNNTTRATALVYQDGVLCKSGDTEKRYLATVRSNGSGNITNGIALRYVWNYYNRVKLSMRTTNTTTTNWDRTSNATWEKEDAGSADPGNLQCVVGVVEDYIDVTSRLAVQLVGGAGNTGSASTAIGYNQDPSTFITTPHANCAATLYNSAGTSSTQWDGFMVASLSLIPAGVGYQQFTWLQYGNRGGAGSDTFMGKVTLNSVDVYSDLCGWILA